MSAKSGSDLLPGFTSTFGAGGPSLTWNWIFLFSRRSSSRSRAMVLWSVSGWHSYPISVSRILFLSTPVAFLLNFCFFFPSLVPDSSIYPHCNGSTGQRPAFSPDAARASGAITPFRERSTPTDNISFAYHQRCQRGLGFSGPEHSCRIIWSSSSVSSPSTRRTIPFFWSPHLVLVPIALSDRDCPSLRSVICEEECYRSEAPKNLEPCS